MPEQHLDLLKLSARGTAQFRAGAPEVVRCDGEKRLYGRCSNNTPMPSAFPTSHLTTSGAKLCRAAGGELEQIQMLLGHASVQTTKRYLGTKQDLMHAPNDAIKLRITV